MHTAQWSSSTFWHIQWSYSNLMIFLPETFWTFIIDISEMYNLMFEIYS